MQVEIQGLKVMENPDKLHRDYNWLDYMYWLDNMVIGMVMGIQGFDIYHHHHYHLILLSYLSS